MPRSGSVTSISELFRFCLFCVAKMKPLTAIVRARRLPERTKTEPGKYSWKFWFFDFSLLSEFRSLCSVQFLSFIFGQKTFAVTLDHRDRSIHDLYALDWSCSGAMIGSNFKTVLYLDGFAIQLQKICFKISQASFTFIFGLFKQTKQFLWQIIAKISIWRDLN